MRLQGLAFVMSSVLLCSCGGGSKGGDAPPASPIQGVVADGYLRGVTVFWDCNGDRQPAPTEIRTTSGVGGAFSIAPAPASACRLTALVPIGAIDEDQIHEPVSRAYVMTTPPGSEAFISPLTTLLTTHLEQNPGATLNAGASSVAQLLGVAQGKVTSNYMLENSADAVRAQQMAKVVRVALQNSHAPSQPGLGPVHALETLAEVSPPLRSQSFATPLQLNEYLDSQISYLLSSSQPRFVPAATDTVRVRPNTALALTPLQRQTLQSVIDDPAIRAITRVGTIHWQELSIDDFEAVLERMKGQGLVAQETPAVLALREKRTTELAKWNAYYSAQVQAKNKFFASDRAANLRFISSTSLATLEAVDGVLMMTDKTGVYAKGSATLKSNIGIGFHSGPERIRDGVMLLLSSMNLSAQALANLDAASRLPDSQPFDDDQKAAVKETIKVLSDYVSLVARNRDWKGLISKAGPALKVLGFAQDCTAADVGQASWAECGAAALSVMELTAEHFGAGHQARGVIQIARTGFDAYVAGEAYARVTDREVYGSMAEVQAEWDAATAQLLKLYKFGEYQLGGYQQYFEAYVPGAFDAQAFAADFGLDRVGATWAFALADDETNAIYADYKVVARSGNLISMAYATVFGGAQNTTVGLVGIDATEGLYLSGYGETTPQSRVFPFLPAMDYGVVESNFFPATSTVGQTWTLESGTTTHCEYHDGSPGVCLQRVTVRTTLLANTQTFAELCPLSPLASTLSLKPVKLEQVYTFTAAEPATFKNLTTFKQAFWMAPGYGFVAKKRLLSAPHAGPLMPGDLCLVSTSLLP